MQALSCVVVSFGGAGGRTSHVAKRRPCWRRGTQRSTESWVPAAQAQPGHMPAVRQGPTGRGRALLSPIAGLTALFRRIQH